MKRILWCAALVVVLSFGSFAQMDNSKDKMSAMSATDQKLVQMEKDLWEAWKGHDAGPFKNYMSADSTDVGAGGVSGKDDSIKMITSPDCKVESYSLDQTSVKWLDKNTALLTYKAMQDATCGERKVPESVWASSIWVKKGGEWKAAFHQETPAMAMNSGQ